MRLAFALFLSLPLCAQVYLGQGCTTAYHIDKDCDGYGIGTSPNDPNPLLGPDADDNDATVYSATNFVAKWGTLAAGLAHLGYSPLRQWFLSTTGNDTTCAVNNASLPCATFAHVAASITAGDAVLWRAGTYSESDTLTVSGTSTNPIILMAYPGESVLFDSSAGDGIDLYYPSYVTIDGLRITNSATGLGYGIAGGGGFNGSINSTGITIRNVEVYNRYDPIILMNGLQNYLIEQSVTRDASNEHCMYLGAETMPSANVTIQHNLCYRTAGNGIKYNGRVTNLVIDSNIVHSVEGAGIDLSEGVSHSYITNNLVFQPENTAMRIYNYWNTGCDNGTQTICPYDQTYNTIENNTFWQGTTDWGGVTLTSPMAVQVFWSDTTAWPSGPVGDLGHQTFRNNIIVTQGTDTAHYPPILFGTGTHSGTTPLSTSTFTDNIMVGGGADTSVVGDGTAASGYGYQGYNCATFASMSTVSGCLNSSPNFVAAGAWNTPWLFNFALQAGSPALRAGTSTGVPAYDIRGLLRASPPDLGALTYNVGTGGSFSGSYMTGAKLGGNTVIH